MTVAPLFGRHAVRRTQEFDRIARLPRRDWTTDAEALAAEVTAALRTPSGMMRLYPIQAAALKEAYENRGLVGALAVGAGKTLTSLLLPAVLDSARPMLVLPAKLLKKTVRERAELAKHWALPAHLKLESYERLGRVSGKQDLENYAPDLLIFDEAHKLKNLKKAACARRVKRYVEDRRKASRPLSVVVLSGTITRRSLRDYEHLVRWALPDGCPLPFTWTEAEDWANALDHLENPLNRVDAGALRTWVGPEEADAPDELTAVRRAYARRFTETPGVVSSRSNELGTSLQIEAVEHTPSTPIDDAFELLRTTWTLPDGWELIDGAAVWAHARELALGFFYFTVSEQWAKAVNRAKEILLSNGSGILSTEQLISRVFENPNERAAVLALQNSDAPINFVIGTVLPSSNTGNSWPGAETGVGCAAARQAKKAFTLTTIMQRGGFAGFSASSAIAQLETWETRQKILSEFSTICAERYRAPREWLEARLAWTRFAREKIKASRAPRVYDSEHDVALNFSDAREYTEWARIRASFRPQHHALWLCTSALELAAAWADSHPRGIVWVEHRAFGLELERLTDIPYFHEMGCDSRGRYIEDASGPVIASIKGNRDGRNLQFKWQDNYVTASPSAGLDYEQLLGRTHRPLQTADEVTAAIFLGCIENVRAFERARVTARYEADSTRQTYKLNYADTNVPNEVDVHERRHGADGYRWST